MKYDERDDRFYLRRVRDEKDGDYETLGWSERREKEK